MKTLRLAGATLNQIPLDWQNNLANIRSAIRDARAAQAKLLLLPELCITGYGCEDLFLSPWVADAAWEKLTTLLPDCTGVTVCVGLPIWVDGKCYNGVAVIHEQQILGITLKQNLAREGVHYEPRWFHPWRHGSVTDIHRGERSVSVGDLVYELHGIRFGFEICEDAWSHDRPGYRLRERNVDLILNASASHFALGKSPKREKEVVIDGSLAFDCAYLFVNHLGNEAGRMIYDGDIVFGQKGKILAVNNRLSFQSFNLLSCDLNFDDSTQSQSIPLTDGRERNEEFARAASLALFDYLRKSKARGFVLSLSGGADSATCAILVSEMVRRATAELGWDAFWKKLGFDPAKQPHRQKEGVGVLLTCAYQSTSSSSVTTLEAARDVANSIGAQFHVWSVDEEVSSYRSKIETALGRKLSWDQDDIALQNIQARARSPIIWMLANINRSLLLTTSNRSEGDVGYATMDGDMSGSLAPIAGVDKPFILTWLAWAEKQLGYAGLAAVNKLPPTAELRPQDRAQTDEKDLMPYQALVAIERLALLERKSPGEVFTLLSSQFPKDDLRKWVRKFFTLWSTNQWKRERTAPSFHFDDLNVDPRSWCRFPILSGGFRDELDSSGL